MYCWMSSWTVTADAVTLVQRQWCWTLVLVDVLLDIGAGLPGDDAALRLLVDDAGAEALLLLLFCASAPG